MYYLSHETQGRPKTVTYKNSLGQVIEERVNRFNNVEEAKKWCWRLNHDYISRAPWYIVQY